MRALEEWLLAVDKRRFFGLVFFAAILIRLAIFMFIPDLEFPDTKTYKLAGYEILSGDYVSNDWYMPLYSIYTYVLSSNFNIKMADMLMSSLTVVVIYYLSNQVFNNEYAARLSAIILAVYPFSVFYSLSMLTESMFVLVYLAGMYFLYRQNYFVASVIFSVSVLIKPLLELIVPILFFVVVLFLHKKSVVETFKVVAVYMLVYATVMSPWWSHNYNRYGSFVSTTLISGHVLYSGNNELNSTGGGISVRDYDVSSYFVEYPDPVERNQAMTRDAVTYIQNNPMVFVDLAVKKFVRFWNIWPNADQYSALAYKAISIGSYGIILLLSVFYAFTYGRALFIEALPLWTVILFVMTISLVTISSIRYRYPIEPILIMFASYWISGRRSEHFKDN